VSRCFQASVADGFLRGRLSDDEFTRALKHAASCAQCRDLLFAASRPAPAPTASESLDDIQDRLTAWRAARRAPLMPAFPWAKGHQVDRYVITRSVGGTEDGVIYEAFDPEREERVVVKQLDLHVEDPATAGLMAVAHQLVGFSHPNVLQLLSVGVHAGFVYVVYELVKGTPLSQASGEDPHALIALYAEAARGLAAAHAAGIVHGCFSAASCVVGRDGRVRVLDFGIGEARVHRAAATQAHRDDDWTVTSAQVNSEDSFVGFVPRRRHPTSGQFESIVLAAGPASLGPRIYAAPELVLGTPPSPAADQFALCAALFHRLYGHPPFDGDTIALWLRGLLDGSLAAPPASSAIPAAVVAALLRGLARAPTARFARMSDLVAKLARPRAVLGSRRTVTALLAAAAVAASGLAVAGVLHRRAAEASGPDCDRSLAGWNTLWSASRQDQLIHASGLAAGDAWPALRTRFDAWIGSWRTATHGFCSVADARAPSIDCASRAHAAANDLLQLVQDGSPGRMIRAAAAAEALPTFDQCASPAPSPALAPLATVQADLRRRLGMLDEADQLIARPAGDPAQRSYQALVRGHTAADRGDVIEARRLFETATFEAAAAHQPELGVTAAIDRLALACAAPERSLWTGYLTQQLQLDARGPAQTAYRGALADSLACEGKLGDAVAHRREVAQALRGDETAAGGAALLALARAELAQGDLAGAEVAARDAASIYGQLWGARHPLTQTARLTLAEAQLESPAAATAAAAALDRVIGETRDHKEPDAVRARALLLQAQLADARGDRDDALRLAARASQEYEAALGGTHPELATALLTAGDLQLAAGKDADADASYRQVAAIFDTLGETESATLAHARAGLLVARWGSRTPSDADEILAWGLAPIGDPIDPAVAGWLGDELARRAGARGDLPAALAHDRAATAAWQRSGDARRQARALSDTALLAAQLHAGDARALLEQALPLASDASRPRLQGALAKLLWPVQRDRARALFRAALAELPEASAEAVALHRWLSPRDDR